jgi:hypothetical protein
MRSLYFLIMALFWSISLPAATYYVDSENGLDSRAGTSEATAWQTLGKVNGYAFVAGDIISFKCGCTWTGVLSISCSGASGYPITYTSYGSGNKPVINHSSNDAIVKVSGSQVVVDGLKLNGAVSTWAGVQTTKESSYSVLRNLEITNTAEGVWIGGSHHLVTSNHIHDLHMWHNDPGGDDDSGARAITFTNATDIEVSYNRIINCAAPSYDYGQDGGAFELWQGSTRVKIHHNYVEKCAGALEAGGTGETVSDYSIYYNVFVNANIGYGKWLAVHVGDKFSINPVNFSVNNNTFVNSGDTWGAGSYLTMKNNVYYNSSGGGTQSNNYSGDPLFVNLGGGDYHLQFGSPAIDAGVNLGYTVDYDGVSVPQGSLPDIGAYEYVSGGVQRLATPSISPTGGPVAVPHL